MRNGIAWAVTDYFQIGLWRRLFSLVIKKAFFNVLHVIQKHRHIWIWRYSFIEGEVREE